MVIPTYVRSRMDQIIDRLIKYSVNTGGHSPLFLSPPKYADRANHRLADQVSLRRIC